MRLLDKYVLKNFLIPFLLCFFGFLAIWLVFDLADNASDFIEGKVGFGFIVQFYATQIPQFVMISLPMGFLLALLYALSRMSRANEIVAMLTAGESLVRLLMPLMLFGLLLTGISAFLNYEMAPHAESSRKLLMKSIGKKREKDHFVFSHPFRNRSDHRMWYIERMPKPIKERSRLEGVHIIQQQADGVITRKWYAREARYTPGTKVWVLTKGKTVEFNEDGDIISETPWKALEIPNWRETPWRIASSNLDSDDLSVPELRDYLYHNSDFPDDKLAPYRTQLHYRWALPWTCFIVVFLAPLGIMYSRRGVWAGVAGAVLFFAGNTFFSYFMLALGKGARVSPFTAAWTSNIIFIVIGVYLLYLRSENRELPRLFRLRG